LPEPTDPSRAEFDDATDSDSSSTQWAGDPVDGYTAEPNLPGPSVPDSAKIRVPASEHPAAVDVVRGLLLALLAVPVGVALWLILWQWGFIASIVFFAVAYLAVRLYRIGARRTLVVPAAVWGIVAIIVATLVLSLLAEIWAELLRASGFGLGDALTSARFWAAYGRLISTPSVWTDELPTIVLSLVFAALGSYRTILRLVREAKGSTARR
jgi:asparagine N-glycosylation enzyme membrane subunit Stt3